MYKIIINNTTEMSFGEDFKDRSMSDILKMIEKLSGTIKINKIVIEKLLDVEKKG